MPRDISEMTDAAAEQEAMLRRKVKAELRKRMRAVRHTAPPDACTARSTKIVAQLLALPLVTEAKTVALFWPIVERHEVDLRALDAELRSRGVRLAYPSIDDETRVMTFREVADVSTLEDRGLGFAEPSIDAIMCTKGEIDVVIVPAIAFDTRGHRIGYGAGFYDRTLPDVAPPAKKVGVAYDYQLLSEVPNEPCDIAVDWVVTDLRVFQAESAD